jgi:membrane associated rhomboid family serine protease
MAELGIVGIVLIIVNMLVSYRGLTNHSFLDTYKFEIDRILIYKEYKRLITSGFLHVSWTHLIFNMLSLLAFSGLLEHQIGSIGFVFVYFASLIGGNLLAIVVHRFHGDYSAVGASGAVCGVIFASIALFPDLGIRFFILPFFIPSWLYGIGFVAYSIYGIKSKKDNIGHEAHLGGALIGLLIAILLKPHTLIENYLPILVIAIPTVLFIYLIATRPHLLFIDNSFFKSQKKPIDIDHQYNENKLARQQEIDRILDKISAKGINSLSKKERQKLDDYSKRRRN